MNPEFRARRVGFAVVVYVALLCAGLLLATQVTAKDSLAPKGAGDRWLPCEKWVMYHWTPIEMPKFYANTRISESELYDWTKDDDNRTLEGLLKSRGLDPKAEMRRSLAAAPGTSRTVRRTLTARAYRLLTQGHLAQHVFFHWFHNPAIRQHSREIFGMNPWDYAKARRLGFSPADLGRLKLGLTREQTATRIVRVMTRYVRTGVKHGATTAGESDHYVRSITRLADEWLDQRYHKPKPTGALPAPTRRRGRGAAGTCRDFVGAGQARDGFTPVARKSRTATVSRLGFCPLAEVTERQIRRRADHPGG